MKRTLQFFALSFSFALLVGIVAASPVGSAASATLETRIERYLQPYVRLHAFSGVVFLARGDEPVFAKPYGMANYEFAVPNRLDTRFAIASITKRFTAIIIARLAQEKRLSGSDALSKWVPDFPSADRITIAHLANHYSGVRDPEKLRRDSGRMGPSREASRCPAPNRSR
jgi:CubicO group peptidase (beta-lactamase class C family)